MCNDHSFAEEQECNFNIFFGVSEALPSKTEAYNQRFGHSVFCDILVLIVFDQIVMGPLTCHAKYILLPFLLCKVAYF